MSRRTETAYKAKFPGELAQHNKAQWFRGYGKCCGCVAKVHALIRGDLSGMRLFDVSFYHSVKLPAGATGLPSPGDIVRASRPISRNKTKRSYSGLVSMRHYKAALYGVTRKVTGQKSAEAIVAKRLF